MGSNFIFMFISHNFVLFLLDNTNRGYVPKCK